MKQSTLILCLSLILTAQAVIAQEDAEERRGPPPSHEGRRGLPPELKAQLTEEQIEQLEKATSHEDRVALLRAWGIKPPQRPQGDHRRGPPPEMTGSSSSSSGVQ